MALLQGILKVHVLEARDLHEVSSFKPQDPYCLLKLGKETQRTAYKSKSGKTANWDEVLQFHLQKQKLNIEEGEFEDLLCVEVWDSNVVKDAFISEVYLRLRDLVSTTDPVVKWYPMNRQEKKGRLLVDVTPQAQYNGAPDVARKVIWPGHCVAGEIKLCTQYFPPMILKIHKARKLYNATWFAHQHPACSIQVGNDYYSTKYVLKGGSEPSWMENFFINPDVRIPRFVKKASESKIVTDDESAPEQYPTSLVSVTVYSAGNIKNDFIGKAVIPLSTLLENNGNPMWFQLGRGSNASIPAGEIMVTLHQCQPRPQASGAPTAAIFGPESMNAQAGQEAAQSAAENRETPASTPHSLTNANASGSTEDLNKASAPVATTPTPSNIAPSSNGPNSPVQTVNHVLPLLSTGSSTPAGMLSPVPVTDAKPAPSASPVKLYDSSEETDTDHPSDAATYWKQFQQQQAKAAAAPVKAEGAPSGVAEPAPSVSAADQLSQASKEEERAHAPGLVGGSAQSDAASTHSTPASPPVPIRAVSVVTQL